MHPLTILTGLAGGLGLFSFGMQMCSEGLQKMAARRLKQLIKVLTSNPVFALLVGAIVTIGLQSSSATSALVIGFINAKLMTLSQALGVLLGSAIGASVTAQLIAFKTTSLALTLLFIGAFLYIFSKQTNQKSIGQTIIGFGLIFYGMTVMTASMAPVRDYPIIVDTLIRLEKYPILEFLMALLVTAIIQSSPAFLALLMSLASQHLIGSLAIVPFVLGAHLGGTITGVISSIGTTGREAKRAALANFFYKLLNGLVFLPLYRPLTGLVVGSSVDFSRQIANCHTFFSLAMAFGFIPFTKTVAQWMKKIIPERQGGLDQAIYLDQNLLTVPELAIDQAHRQTLEMGNIVAAEMLNEVVPLLNYGNIQSLDRIAEVEKAIDSLYKKISKYVTSLGNKNLQEDLMHKSIQILYVANDLEHIGDIIINVAKHARKLDVEDLEFSEEGFKEIEKIFNQTYNNFKLSLKSFAEMDPELAVTVIKEHPKILRLEKQLRYSHFDRMQCGNARTVATSSIHLDLIEDILRIDMHSVNIAQCVMGIV
ncbi:MAG: Na/Pi cotransporter family protein [Bacteroidota bacterium]